MTKEILRTIPLAHGIDPKGRCFMSLYRRDYTLNGKTHQYFMAARQDPNKPISDKRPEAVIVIAIYEENGQRQLVVTSEYRVPIGGREISFPAGLVDEKDYVARLFNDQEVANQIIQQAAFNASVRELREETGLTFEPKFCSPTNLYSSSGMTDESVILVFGKATGKINYSHQEETEDIEVMLLDQDNLVELTQDDSEAFGKVAWPFLWAFSVFGIPDLDAL